MRALTRHATLPSAGATLLRPKHGSQCRPQVRSCVDRVLHICLFLLGQSDEGSGTGEARMRAWQLGWELGKGRPEHVATDAKWKMAQRTGQEAQ